MIQSLAPYVILGPAPCKDCRVLVWWIRVRGFASWFEGDGTPHYCSTRKTA